MKINKKLAITIPTYNRSDVLDKLLYNILPMVEKHSIPIYISDNCSTDNTEFIVKKWMNKYNHIYYEKNNLNLGADRNFEKVLKMSTAEYSWLLGDDDIIVSGAIDKVLSIINGDKEHDFIVVNGSDKEGKGLKSRLESNVYTDHNKLLSDLWYTMTWMSSLIFKKNVILEGDFEKFYDTNFLQAAVVFDFLSNKENIRVYWNSEPLVYYPDLLDIVNPYTSKEMYFFIKCWIDVINLLPNNYTVESKYNAIKSGASFKFILNVKANGFFGLKEYVEYKDYFSFFSNKPLALFLLVAIIPNFPFKILRIIYQKYFRRFLILK